MKIYKCQVLFYRSIFEKKIRKKNGKLEIKIKKSTFINNKKYNTKKWYK